MAGFAALAKPLIGTISGTQPLQGTDSEKQRAFETLKKDLISAAALDPPGVSKPLYLYVSEARSIVKGGLAQGPWERSVASLAKT